MLLALASSAGQACAIAPEETSERASVARSPDTSSPSPSLSGEQQRALDELLESYRAKHGIPGLTGAIALDGRVIWERGYGLSDLENDVRARPDTAYRSASIGKCITATAAMLLVERGALDLDAPIQQYTDAFPAKPWPITARHLLTHTSGIRHYGGPRNDEEQTSTVHYSSVADALAPFRDDALLFEPGTEWSYSTYGYDVLGCVLEGAAKLEFMELVRRLVFEPCGMVDSRADDPVEIVPRRAAGYALVDGRLRNATHVDMSNRLPAGGYLTTAPDLARFGAGFIGGVLVSPATRDAMLNAVRLRNGDSVNYGLGWALTEDDAGGMDGTASHGGSSPGASGILYIDPAHRLALAFLSNLEATTERSDTARAMARIVCASGDGRR